MQTRVPRRRRAQRVTVVETDVLERDDAANDNLDPDLARRIGDFEPDVES